MTHQPTRTEQRASQLAATALHHGLRGEWKKATRVVQRLSDETGTDGIDWALLRWADTLIARMPGDTNNGIRIMFLDVDDAGAGALKANADDVPPPARWAGRMIAARATDDPATWEALKAAVPRDPEIRGQHVAALLETVALTLGHLRSAT